MTPIGKIGGVLSLIPRRLVNSPHLWLVLLPALYCQLMLWGPWISDSEVIYGGAIAQAWGALVPGYSTIDPNIGTTSYTLGLLAVRQLSHLQLPTWNYYEGLGQPLLGGLIGAALFPPTLLLALPNGQVIEHVVLQIISGLGMFSLLRLLQFQKRTCLLLAVAFEFCALFVWLKNAMINPIPFLVWLLVYALRLMRPNPIRAWLPDALGMGLAAGCAVLGGFPETVLIFTNFLLAWVFFYFWHDGVSWRDLRAAIFRYGTALIIALSLAGSILVALLAIAPVANFGTHLDTANSAAHLGWTSALKYLLPYISGPIFGYDAKDEIGSIGGYTGIGLPLLAFVGLFTPGRASERIFWTGVTLICVAVSQGVQPLHNIAMMVPGLALTAFYRQANIVWIITLICLAAHAVDCLSKISKVGFAAVACCGIATLAIVAFYNRTWLEFLWALDGLGPWITGSVMIALALAVVLIWALYRQDGFVALLVIVGEAGLMFLVPVLSLPTGSHKDTDFITFLQKNAQYERVVNFGENIIATNYGSAFGIRQLNFDSNPVPQSTTRLVHDYLDPMYNPEIPIYIQNYPVNMDTERTKYMKNHIENYGQVGVRFVLTPPDVFDLRSPVKMATNVPFALMPGEVFSFKLALHSQARPSRTSTNQSGDLAISAATYGSTTDGYLDIDVCLADQPCRSKSVESKDIIDNGMLVLAHDVILTEDEPLTIILRKVGGVKPLALWLYQPAETQDNTLTVTEIQAAAGGNNGRIPDLYFTVDSVPGLRRVFYDDTGDIYEVEHARPYMSALGCNVAILGFDRAAVDCEHPSALDRLEIWMPGWRATVDGRERPVIEQAAFQRVTLDSGRHVVRFIYNPYDLRAWCWLTIASLFGVGALWSGLVMRSLRWRRPSVTGPLAN